MTEWNPIETAPHNTEIWVKNDQMKKPVLATRGWRAVQDEKACSAVHSGAKPSAMPGRLIVATHWKPKVTNKCHQGDSQ